MQLLSRLKQRDIALIAIVLTVLALMVWYFSFYQPVRADIDTRRSELETKKSQITALLSAEAQLPLLRKTVAELQAQQDEFSRALPKTQEIGNLIRDLQVNLAASGSDISSLSQGAAGAPSGGGALPAGVQAVTLSLGMSGSFDALYRSLQALEQMQRYSAIQNVNVTLPGEVDTFDPKLTSTLNLTVYTFDPTQATAAPVTPEATPPAGSTPPAPASTPGGRS